MTPEDGTRPAEGWVYLINSRRRHYINPEGRSLCRLWGYLGSDLDPSYADRAPRTDLCKACLKALERRRARAQK